MSRNAIRLLVDGDILLHRAAYLAEVPIDWGDGTMSTYANVATARTCFDRELQETAGEHRAVEVVVCLSDVPEARGGALPWRKAVMPSYKANRSSAKPVVFWPLREYVEKTYDCDSRPSLEGDDVMGIRATAEPGRWVIVSPDKDMATVPGRLIRGMTGEITTVTEAEADHNHLFLALAGDPTDGYSGCPGVGKVRATRILEDAEDPWAAIIKSYERSGLTSGDALRNARVARVLRKGEIVEEVPSDPSLTLSPPVVILWNPPSPN